MSSFSQTNINGALCNTHMSNGFSVMAKAPNYEQIVAAASSRCDVVIQKDDLRKIRGCKPDSVLARWIEQSLTADTLLSSEELTLAENLSKHEGLRGESTDEGDWGGVPTSEEELLEAIADLDASTEALNRQSKALSAQWTLVKRRNDGNGNPHRRRDQNFVDQLEQGNLAEIQRLKADIFDVQEEIEVLFRNMKDTIDKASRRFPSLISELINSNDRTLDDLTNQHLAGACTARETSTSLDTVQRLTANLSSMLAEELQTRLDRTYLESLQKAVSDETEAAEDVGDLEEDIRSLYIEIPDVADMYVTQKYGEPLVKAVREEERRRKAVASLHTDKISSQLSTMAVDLEQLAERLATFHSYRSMVQNLRGSYDHFANSSTVDISSPTKAESKLPQHFGPAMEALLRHFGLPTDPASSLHDLISDKVARLHDSGQRSAGSVNRDSKATLEARKNIVESLVQNFDQNGSQTSYNLDVLEARVTELREQVERVSNTDKGPALRKQRDFIEKWS